MNVKGGQLALFNDFLFLPHTLMSLLNKKIFKHRRTIASTFRNVTEEAIASLKILVHSESICISSCVTMEANQTEITAVQATKSDIGMCLLYICSVHMLNQVQKQIFWIALWRYALCTFVYSSNQHTIIGTLAPNRHATVFAPTVALLQQWQRHQIANWCCMY